MFRSRWARPFTLSSLGTALWFIAFCIGASPASARLPKGFDPLKIYREAPKISVLTMGPGEHSFEKFGHNAIRVVDPVRRTDRVYNYGTFAFGDGFVATFLQGRLRYWLGVSSFAATRKRYAAAGRALYEQQLNLDPDHAHQVQDMLEENAKPENRYYLYDYYADNCSTRIRDVIDSAISGKLAEAHSGPSTQTERDHTLRHVASDLWLYAGLDFALGPSVDQQRTRWDDLFLPFKLRQGLSMISFQGAHGGFQLVREEKIWSEQRLPNDVRSEPPDRLGSFFQAGSGLALGFAFLGWEALRRRLRWAGWVVLGGAGSLGIAAGLLGTLLCLLWAFSDHAVSYRNENILQCAPWLLAMGYWIPGAFRGRVHALGRLQAFCLSAAAASAAGALFKITPVFPQENQRIIAFCLPLWIGLFFAVRSVRQRAERDERHRSLLEATDEEATAEPLGAVEATEVPSEHPSARHDSHPNAL